MRFGIGLENRNRAGDLRHLAPSMSEQPYRFAWPIIDPIERLRGPMRPVRLKDMPERLLRAVQANPIVTTQTIILKHDDSDQRRAYKAPLPPTRQTKCTTPPRWDRLAPWPCNQAAESSPAWPPWRDTFKEIPSSCALTAAAPTERPSCAALFAHGSFCAMFFNFAMSSAVQRRNVGLGMFLAPKGVTSKMSKCRAFQKVPHRQHDQS
jgi:hypothetical protein